VYDGDGDGDGDGDALSGGECIINESTHG